MGVHLRLVDSTPVPAFYGVSRLGLEKNRLFYNKRV